MPTLVERPLCGLTSLRLPADLALVERLRAGVLHGNVEGWTRVRRPFGLSG